MVSFGDRIAGLFGSKAPITVGMGRIFSTDNAGSNDYALYDEGVARSLIDGMDAGDLYATQPHLRTVVSFVARNAAQLGRHVYSKDADGERSRAESGSAVKLLSHPNEYMTGYDLFNMLFTELALYDFALWTVRMTETGDWAIDPIPGSWITGIQAGDAFRVAKYRVQAPGSSEWRFIEAKDAIVFRGYNSKSFKRGSSAVESLRATLAEQVAAMTFRQQLWARGGRVGMFMTRPKDAPQWSPEAKTKFIQMWKGSWSGNGANAGSTPLLEDGMELKRVGFTAKEEQWIEAATLSLTTVAASYHVPPAMVGVSGYNSFASVKEFRKMLYTETLGPLIAQVEDVWNTFLMPMIGAPKGQYLELNIAEKLQGDFEEQAAQLFQAVGGPYMTAAEARKKMNLPYLEGTDELLAPLNMGAAGNNGPAADATIDDVESEEPPANTPTPGKSKGPRSSPDAKAPKLRVPATQEEKLAEDLADFFKRQGKVVSGKINGEKAPEWWDQKRWNRDLSAVLLPHLTSMSAGVAKRVAGAKGLDYADYSVGQTANFLKAVSDSRADLINSTTRDRVKKAIDDGNEIDLVFTEAVDARAPQASKTLSTFTAGWAVTEVARQLLADKKPQKTWVSSGLPNSRHSGLDGETVGIDQKFSNGADWPGDPTLGAEEVANCGCGVDITY